MPDDKKLTPEQLERTRGLWEMNDSLDRDDISALFAHVAAQAAEIERLRTDLLEFGQHAPGCNADVDESYKCKCGWATTKAALND